MEAREGSSRTQEWNAICLDIGEKIGRRRYAIRLLKELREAAPVGYERTSASVLPLHDQLWTTFCAGLIARTSRCRMEHAITSL